MSVYDRSFCDICKTFMLAHILSSWSCVLTIDEPLTTSHNVYTPIAKCTIIYHIIVRIHECQSHYRAISCNFCIYIQAICMLILYIYRVYMYLYYMLLPKYIQLHLDMGTKNSYCVSYKHAYEIYIEREKYSSMLSYYKQTVDRLLER